MTSDDTNGTSQWRRVNYTYININLTFVIETLDSAKRAGVKLIRQLSTRIMQVKEEDIIEANTATVGEII